MNRDNHYEAAFDAFLRARGVAVVAVDEARRSYIDETSIKSPDFLVVGEHDARLVVDVKGRKFPGGTSEHPRMVWQNWSTREDIDGLDFWTNRFGPSFRGVLAFVYQILPCVELPEATPDLFEFRDRVYLMRGVCVRQYRTTMRQRSPRWGTVHLPTADFRKAVKPFSHFLGPRSVESKQITAENAEFAES
ncbi:MAG: HYExAFE family protein [Planctomycetes bacterium]|nr:HYExAFE family protein [Planctomycetota bacterium]